MREQRSMTMVKMGLRMKVILSMVAALALIMIVVFVFVSRNVTEQLKTSFSSRGSNESVVLGSGLNSVLNNGNESRNIPNWTWAFTPTFYGEMGSRPWFFRADFLYRGESWADDEQVAADLAAGLRSSFFERGEPDFEAADLLRLELVSAGRDGQLDTADDIRFISYVPVGLTLRLLSDRDKLQRQMDMAYTQGRHHFRLEGNRFSLLDARRLAESRLETLT